MLQNITSTSNKPLSFLTIMFMFISIEKNEMGGACSSDGGEERRVQDFGGEI
jgi:hypothetical protein